MSPKEREEFWLAVESGDNPLLSVMHNLVEKWGLPAIIMCLGDISRVLSEDAETADKFRSAGHTVKDKEEGATVVFKRKVHGPNGMIRNPPKLIDRFKHEMDCQVGNGSTVRVQYKEWESNRQGKLWKGLDLQAVQVIDLVTYSKGGLDEFDVIEEEVDEL